MLTGRVDELQHNKVWGWAFNSEQPDEQLVIRIMRGPKVVASGVANLFRKDLPDAGIGDGHHAFGIEVPPEISTFSGLMIIAQSQKAGEVPLPIANNEDRKLDQIFGTFAERYDEALVMLKREIDQVKEYFDSADADAPAQTGLHAVELPPDLVDRFAALERRMDAAEVFFVRIDETVRKLTDQKKGGRRRFLGIF